MKKYIYYAIYYVDKFYLKAKSWFLKEYKLLAMSFVLGLLATVMFAFVLNTYSETIQQGIAKNVLRFHVLANSNEEYDQELKLEVRNGILQEYYDLLSSSSNVEQTREDLMANLENIELCAENIVKAEGYDYDVSVSIGYSIFPTKQYGDISFPAGKYEALKVEIGKGEGNNWWCVMFPPLCFVDITQGDVIVDESEENIVKLEDVLTDEEFDIVAKSGKDGELPIKVKFKIVEWWQELKWK